jgi:hypothetical protein
MNQQLPSTSDCFTSSVTAPPSSKISGPLIFLFSISLIWSSCPWALIFSKISFMSSHSSWFASIHPEGSWFSLK